MERDFFWGGGVYLLNSASVLLMMKAESLTAPANISKEVESVGNQEVVVPLITH